MIFGGKEQIQRNKISMSAEQLTELYTLIKISIFCIQVLWKEHSAGQKRTAFLEKLKPWLLFNLYNYKMTNALFQRAELTQNLSPHEKKVHIIIKQYAS